METFLFLLFILIPKFVLGEDDESENVIISRSSTQSINGAYGFMYFVYAALLLYFIVILFMGICRCKPGYSKPTCCEFLFHIFSSSILLIVSILYFISISKFQSLTKDRFFSFKYQNIFPKSTFDFKEAFENISNINDCSSKTSIQIKKMAFDYNSTFSEQNSEFRKAFNNLYFNFEMPKYFKDYLKGMDESRTNIISKILALVDKHEQNSLSVIKVFNNLHKNFFNNIISSTNIETQNRKQIKSNSGKIMDFTFCYLIVVCLMILVIVVGIIYFFSNKCSRCCYFSFPIYAIAIIIASLVSNLCLTSGDYKEIYNTCKFISRSTMSNQIDGILHDINKVINNFEFGYELIYEKEEVSIFCNNLSSNIMHENYSKMYSHYSFNDEYRNDLAEIVKTINSKENDLQKMKYLFNEIIRIDDDIISLINEIKYYTSLFMENTKQSINKITQSNEILSSYKSRCNSMFKTHDINLAATYLMLIGLFLLSVSVCLRRKTLKSSFCFDFEDKSNSSGMEDTREKVRPGKSNNDPFKLENGNDIEGYIFGFMKLGMPEPAKDYINEEGELGKGIYIFLDKEEFMGIYKDIYPIKKYPVIYLIPVIVHSKSVLNIGNKTNLFSLPEAAEKYSFDCVKFIAKNETHRLLICNAKIIEFGKEIKIDK